VTDATGALDFLVHKTDWKRHRFVAGPVPELAAGQVLFRVDRFAFTANNISYALTGDLLGYWRFFPTDAEGWGRLPTMGFGDVIRSTHPGVAEGTRCFGFYPMSRHLVIQPGAVSPAQIVDAAPHRQGLAPAYAQYTPTQHDALYTPEHEDALLLFRGLFMTAFLADDFLAEQAYCGAKSVLISSASSKTSIALAYQVGHAKGVRSVGLTSARHLDFVKSLGCYDAVLPYGEVGTLPPAEPAVFVDMAGNGELLRAVHTHFGTALKHSCSIGATHWDSERNVAELPGPRPEFFFAPAQIQKRVADWGAAGLQQRLAAAWSAFRDFTGAWLRIERGAGREAIERVYTATLAGRSDPATGHVLSAWESQEAAAGS